MTFFDTADMYDMGASEEITGRLLRRFFPAATTTCPGDQGLLPGRREGRTTAGLSRKHIRSAIEGRRCAASAPTSRGPLPDPPLGPGDPDRGDDGRPRGTWCGGQGPVPGGVEHVRLGFAKAQHVGGDAVRLHAAPLQPPLPRGGAGDDPALPGPGRRCDPVEPVGARRPAERADDDPGVVGPPGHGALHQET